MTILFKQMEDTIMKNTFIYLLLINTLISLIIFNGCEDNPEGACVIMEYNCDDGYKLGKCNMMNGTFYEGTTCKELGFSNKDSVTDIGAFDLENCDIKKMVSNNSFFVKSSR